MQVEGVEETSPLCEIQRSKYAVLTTTTNKADVSCVNCLIVLEQKAEEEQTNQFSFRVQDCLPMGYMIDADCAVSTAPVPVYAKVDGKKVLIGEGKIDPETFLFTAKVNGSDEAKKVMEYVRGTRDANGKTGAGMIEVSEVTLKADVETVPLDGPSEDNGPTRKS